MIEPYDAERLKELINDITGLSIAAVNVERARMSGIAEHLAGWEHNTIREAATALAAQAEQLATLRTEVDDMRAKAVSNAQERNAGQQEVAAQAEEIERLRKALKPFAEIAIEGVCLPREGSATCLRAIAEGEG